MKILTSALIALLAVSCQAQQARYELGIRVKRFEQLFEKSIDKPEARRDVLPFLESAVGDFFTMRMSAACQKLDEATTQLSDQKDLCREFLPLQVEPASRLLDQSSRELGFVLRPYYGVFPNPDLQVTVALYAPDGKLVQSQQLPLGDRSGTLAFPKLTEGDYKLACQSSGGAALRITQTISVVHNLDARLAALRERIDELDADKTGPLARSLRHRTRAVQKLQKKQTPETDMPVFQLVTELEEWAGSGKRKLDGVAGKTTVPVSRIVLTSGRKSLPCRISLPAKSVKGQKTPLVIALHGAGGSENMFFEAYGAGKVFDLAGTRDWILISPRISLFGLAMTSQQMIESLEAQGISVDRSNVFVVGHSMGAGAAMQLANQPTALRAIAALGGGGSARLSDSNKAAKCFVAAGDRDFGRGGAATLARGLKQFGAEVEFKTYKNTEHLGVVQVALEDVFGFFDANVIGEER